MNAGRTTSWRKKAKIGRVLYEQIGPEGVVKTGSSVISQGHPRSLRMVPSDGKQNFLHFLFPRPCAYLASFLSYGEKTKFRKTKVGCHSDVPWKIKNRGSDWPSTAIAEPNCKNRVKIRPVETEIKWLTKIVKKEAKHMATLLRRYRLAK